MAESAQQLGSMAEHRKQPLQKVVPKHHCHPVKLYHPLQDPGLLTADNMYEGDFNGEDAYGEDIYEDEANLGQELQEEGTADEAVEKPAVKADVAGKNLKIRELCSLGNMYRVIHQY